MQATLPETDAATNRATWRRVVFAIFVLTGTAIVLAAWLDSARKSQYLAWDFAQFYIASKLPISLIYNHTAEVEFGQKHLAPLGVSIYPPFVRPSVFVPLLRPLAIFPYWTAFGIWAGVGLSAYFASVILLIHRFRLPILLIPAYAGFFPAIVGLVSGQDSCVVLLAIVGAWLLLERGRDRLAGAVIALCLYKYNLILLIPLLFIIKRRYKALASFGIGATILTASSLALASPREYLNLLIALREITPGYADVGLIGFSQAVRQPWCYPVLAVIAFAVCCWLMRRLPLPEAFCIAIVGMLLISPHITWYDSTLLALPIGVVFARSGTAMRVVCLAILVTQPLWLHGGGNNGQAGFTHAAVESFILGYFVWYAVRRNRTGQASEHELRVARIDTC